LLLSDPAFNQSEAKPAQACRFPLAETDELVEWSLMHIAGVMIDINLMA